MTTESNMNNFASNLSGTNIDMSENAQKEIKPEDKYSLEKFTQPPYRYSFTFKKRA